MITYTYNKKKGILETTLKDVITIEDIVEYIYSLCKNRKLPKVLKIFSDASEAEFDLDVDTKDLIKIVEANNKHLEKRKMICDAYVVSRSFETAFGHLYIDFSKAENYHFNVFPTKGAAIEWLNSF